MHQCQNEMYAYFSAVSLVTGVIIHAIGTDTESQWPPFCQQTGPQTSFIVMPLPCRQFFSEMFTLVVWDLVVDVTNRYAHFKLRNPPSCHGIMSGGSQRKSQRWSSYIIKNMLGVNTMDQLAT